VRRFPFEPARPSGMQTRWVFALIRRLLLVRLHTRICLYTTGETRGGLELGFSCQFSALPVYPTHKTLVCLGWGERGVGERVGVMAVTDTGGCPLWGAFLHYAFDENMV